MRQSGTRKNTQEWPEEENERETTKRNFDEKKNFFHTNFLKKLRIIIFFKNVH